MTALAERSTSTTMGAIYLERAREILPLLRDQARAIEEARELTPPVVNALAERNLFQVLLAPARGEGDLRLAEVLAILGTLASADASTAWDVMASMGACFLSAFLSEETVARIFASPSDTAATAVGRIGKATLVDGGYMVEAKWPFLSGSPHATWIGGLGMVFDGESPQMSPGGQPHIIVPFIRKERLNMLDTWDVTGLRGTGSHEAQVNGVFVPDSEVADFAKGPRPDIPPFYLLAENIPAPLAAASVALGIAASAIASFRETMPSRQHQSGVSSSVAPLPQLALAEAEARFAAAKAHIDSVAAWVDAEMEAGRIPAEDGILRASLAATASTEAAVEIVSKLYRAAGASAVFTGSPLERALRDVFTIGAHRMLQRENYLVHAPDLFA